MSIVVAMRKRWRYLFASLLIIAACCTLYLTGAGRVALWDRDEGWYAEASRQMLETHNWVVPYFLEAPRFAKPIFIYWCQSFSMHLLGVNSLAARLPSAIGMTLTLILLASVLSWKVGARRATWTTLVFGTAAMVIVSAKMCLTDAVMMVFITSAQFALYGIYRKSRPRRYRENEALSAVAIEGEERIKTSKLLALPLVLWIGIALAALTKGPFALVVLFASMVALACFDVGRRWKSGRAWRGAMSWWPRTRPLMGLVIIVIVVAPWLILFAIQDPTNLLRMLNQPFEHLAHNRDGHSGYPGYYVLTVWLTFFPWSLLLPTAIVLGFKHRATPQIRFALATILGNLVFIDLMVTKLPHYLLPSYAAMAFLVATALIRNMRGQYRDFTKKSFLIGAVCWTVAATVLALLPWFPAGYFPSHFPVEGAAVFSIVGIIYAILVSAYFIQHQYARAAATMGIGMIAVIIILFSMYLPHASFIWMAHDAGGKLTELGATDVVMTDFDEPTLAFYQGGTIRDERNHYLFETPADEWPAYVVLSRKSLEKLPAEKRARLEELANYPGFNYAGGGKMVDVIVARKVQANGDTGPVTTQPASQPRPAAQPTTQPMPFKVGTDWPH